MKTLRHRGFSIVELLVVVSIVGILSAVIITNINSARKSGRDAQRKSDLTNLKAAIEMYRQKNGVYPAAGCSKVSPNYATEANCSSGYILGLTPNFISKLPTDPNRDSNEGYSYTVNSSKTVFKLMAMNTVEHEIVDNTTAMNSCDVGTSGLCSSTVTPCRNSDAVFKSSYGVWGGFDDGADDAAVKTATALVICK